MAHLRRRGRATVVAGKSRRWVATQRRLCSIHVSDHQTVTDNDVRQRLRTDCAVQRGRWNEKATIPLTIMSYTVAIIIVIALVIGITALNVSHRHHRSRLSKRQSEREDHEHKVECGIW
jgi:Ca2+/H+ antiporter